MNAKHFKMSLDMLNIVLSCAVALVSMTALACTILLPLLLFAGKEMSMFLTWYPVIFSGTILLLLPLAALFAQRGCSVTDTHLTVTRALMPVKIPLKEILEVAPASPSGTWRACGCGGFLGTWGRLRCRELGPFRGYLTKDSGYVVITRAAEPPVVLTPDDPEGFVQAMRGALGIDCRNASNRDL